MSDSGAADADGISETTTRLRERLGRTEGNGTGSGTEDNADTEDAEEADSETESDGERPDVMELVARAEADLEELLGILRGDRKGTLTEAKDDVEDLIEVIDEAEDLLSTVNLSALPEAVEWTELPKAVDTGEIPNAVATGEASEAVQFRKLLQIINLRQVFDNVDLRSLWQQKGELDDAVADATDGNGEPENGEDSSILDRFRNTEGDNEGNGSVLDRFRDEESTTGSDDATRGIGPGLMDTGSDDDDDAEAEGGGIPSELIQARVQSKLGDAIDEFRDSALDARDRLNEMRERSKTEFREKTGQTGQPNSRSPTAYSTLPVSPDNRGDIGGVARFSTMSRTPRHSSAPGRDHIYGDRFENRNQQEDENNE